MNINKIRCDNLLYDNSLKKIISKIKYNDKKIVIKLEDIEIVELDNNMLSIKNSNKIKNVFHNINNILQERFKINNFIFNNNFDDELLQFHCFIKTFNKIPLNKITMILSHLEFIANKTYCQCYVINVS